MLLLLLLVVSYNLYVMQPTTNAHLQRMDWLSIRHDDMHLKARANQKIRLPPVCVLLVLTGSDPLPHWFTWWAAQTVAGHSWRMGQEAHWMRLIEWGSSNGAHRMGPMSMAHHYHHWTAIPKLLFKPIIYIESL